MRKSLDQQGIALKNLEAKFSAQPSGVAEAFAAQRKQGSELIDQGKRMESHALVINKHTRDIAGIGQHVTALTVASGGIGVLLVLVLVVALWNRFGKRRHAAGEQFFGEAMAQGRAPTADEITAVWNRIAGTAT